MGRDGSPFFCASPPAAVGPRLAIAQGKELLAGHHAMVATLGLCRSAYSVELARPACRGI
jgi:hypothetical protein